MARKDISQPGDKAENPDSLNHSGQRVVVRTIHHMAASGGTVMSKCLAVQPNVNLLSEINPYSNRRSISFNPAGPLQQFRAQYGLGDHDLLRRDFNTQLEIILGICAKRGKSLVMRDHSHSDFMARREPVNRSLLECLDGYDSLSIVTIRDPVDSFLSALNKRWLGRVDNDFEQYCQRYLKFMQAYSEFSVYRYEDFCRNPDQTVKEMCDRLQLEFDPCFQQKYSGIKLTGDSGRGGSSITTHARHDISPEVKKSIESSASYREFCQLYGYVYEQ